MVVVVFAGSVFLRMALTVTLGVRFVVLLVVVTPSVVVVWLLVVVVSTVVLLACRRLQFHNTQVLNFARIGQGRHQVNPLEREKRGRGENRHGGGLSQLAKKQWEKEGDLENLHVCWL